LSIILLGTNDKVENRGGGRRVEGLGKWVEELITDTTCNGLNAWPDDE